MRNNLGKIDRIFRFFSVVVIAVLFYTITVSGITGLTLMIAAGVLFATSLIGFCPLYAILGISTCKAKRKDAIV